MGINERGIFFGCFAILAIYHILVFAGRRKDYLNLLYAFYCLAIANVVLASLIFPDQYDTKEFAVYFVISCHLIAGTLLFFIYVFLNMLKTKLAKISIIYYAFLTISLAVIISFAVILKDHFIIYLYSPLVMILGIYLIITIVINSFIRKRINDRKTIIILTGFFIVLIYLVTFSILLFFRIKLPHITAYSIFLINALIFAYALTDNFNQEHNDLIDIKKNLENKISERTRQLEEANRQKTNFFINLAHETKTPLTLILNYFIYYKKHFGSKQGKNELDIIEKNLYKLKKDMLNFLTHEKLVFGKKLFDHDQVVCLNDYLDKNISIYRITANKKKILIDYNKTGQKYYIKIDPSALDEILNNIIMNAINYTDNGGIITINLSLEGCYITLIISDTGIGMSEDQLEHIFKSYYQISNQKRNMQGMGIGLTIVKDLMTQINGKISVTSRIGEGSSFHINFINHILNKGDVINRDHISMYNEESQIITKPEISHLPENYEPDKESILIIEDNLEMLNYLYLELCDNYNIYYSFNGMEALNKLGSISRPVLIVCDIMMDQMGGYEFFERLQNTNYKDIPLIFLTAKTDETEKIKGLKMGAVDYIYKPFLIEELKLKLGNIIKINDMQRESNKKEFIKNISALMDNSNHEHFRINDKGDEEKYYDLKPLKAILTKKKIEIVDKILKGKMNKEISNDLNISTGTVKNHVSHIFKIFNVQNRIELINKIQEYLKR